MTHKCLTAYCASLVSEDASLAQGVHLFWDFFEMKAIEVNLEDKLSRQMEAEKFKEDNHSV